MTPLLEVKAGDTFERVFERVLAGVAEPFASGTVIRAQIRRQPGGGTADLLADFAVEILDQTAFPGRFVLRVERSVTAAWPAGDHACDVEYETPAAAPGHEPTSRTTETFGIRVVPRVTLRTP